LRLDPLAYLDQSLLHAPLESVGKLVQMPLLVTYALHRQAKTTPLCQVFEPSASVLHSLQQE
jgi:hypothetical protein